MEHEIEGIVFWKDGEPRCKIKRSDFGFEWPAKHCGFYTTFDRPDVAKLRGSSGGDPREKSEAVKELP